MSPAPDQLAVLEGTLVPSIPGPSYLNPDGGVPVAVGVLGAVIMPHNLYLHSNLVLSFARRPAWLPSPADGRTALC